MSRTRNRLSAPIVFIGPGRSGSTIISEIVLAHESLAWPSNHVELLPRLPVVNLLRPLFDNRFWRLIGEKGQLNQTRFLNSLLPLPAEAFPFWERISRSDLDFSRGFLLGERASDEERRRIRAEISRLVAWQGKQRFAMKLTGPARIGYLQSIFPDARFINIVRDPVATVRSLLEVPFWRDLGMHRLWWQGAYNSDELEHFETIRHDPVAVTAFQVGKVLEMTLVEARQCQARMLTVRYEDFVADPSSCIRTICDFAGLTLSSALQAKLEQTAVHNRNRRKQRPEDDQASAIRRIVESQCAAGNDA